MKLKKETKIVLSVILIVLVVACVLVGSVFVLTNVNAKADPIKMGNFGKKELWKNVDKQYSDYEILQYGHFGGGEGSGKGEEALLYQDGKFIYVYYTASGLFSSEYTYGDNVKELQEDNYLKTVFKKENYIATTEEHEGTQKIKMIIQGSHPSILKNYQDKFIKTIEHYRLSDKDVIISIYLTPEKDFNNHYYQSVFYSIQDNYNRKALYVDKIKENTNLLQGNCELWASKDETKEEVNKRTGDRIEKWILEYDYSKTIE